MAKIRGAIVVDTEKCKGCNVCVPTCPTDVIVLSDKINSKGYNYLIMENPEACIACNNCAIVCPDGVISVYRVKIEDNKK